MAVTNEAKKRKYFFLAKNIYLTKFQKLASERNFDLHPNKTILTFF